ncbi:phosphopantothenoylcysteine decarboxylase-like protein [Tanacetum coccineum]
MVQEASESHGVFESSESDEGLELIQEEDTQPSENTSEIHNEVEPQNVEVPIRRSEWIPQAPDRYGIYVDVDEYELGYLNEPPNYKVALSDPESDKWLKAMNTKMQSMKDNQVWVLVELPPNGRTIESKWLFKKKSDMDGKMEYKFQDQENSKDIFNFRSALEDFICVVFVLDRNIHHVWGLTPTECPKVMKVGDLMTGEPMTKAPMNSGCNYNGPKRLGEIDMFVKMRTTCTWIERPYEASLFLGIGFGLFLCSLGRTSQGTVSGRQFLWGVGLPKGNGGVQRFPQARRSASYSAYKYVKLIQELLGYVRDTCLDIHKPSEKLVAVTPINKKKTTRVSRSTKSSRSQSTDNTKNDRILQISSSTQKKNKVEDHSRIVNSMFDARHELCFLEFVSDMNASSKSKSVKKAKKKEEWKRNATSSRGNTTSGQARVVKCYNCQGEGHTARQCTQPKRLRNEAWYKEKAMLAEAQEAGQILDEEQLAFLADPGIPAGQAQTIIPHNAAFQTEDLDTYDSDCDDLSTAQAVLMANISNYGSDVISEVVQIVL